MSLPYVITLSAVPPRFGLLGPPLVALLAQRPRAETVTLYIPRRYRRFPDWDGTLPAVPKGVEIRRTEEDLGPATKVLFAADELKGQAARILFCDDDHIYRPGWARHLLAAAARHPGHAVVTTGFDIDKLGFAPLAGQREPRAGRIDKRWDWRYHIARLGQRIARVGKGKVPSDKKAPRFRFSGSGYVHIGQGFGGFLIEPHHVPREAWDIPPVLWSVDDVWLSGHLARNGVPIWIEGYSRPFAIPASQDVSALYAAVIDDTTSAQANHACVEYMRKTYEVWTD